MTRHWLETRTSTDINHDAQVHQAWASKEVRNESHGWVVQHAYTRKPMHVTFTIVTYKEN